MGPSKLPPMTIPIPLDRIDPARFWAHTTPGPQPDPELYPDLTRPCLDTAYPKHQKGYGKIDSGSRGLLPRIRLRTHRVAFELANGPGSATGVMILHRCDRPSCVEPTHLYVGDHAANMADRRSRGRHQPNAKLTEAQVTEIRRRFLGGEVEKVLAREFDVDPATVRMMLYPPDHLRATWKHVPWPDPPPS